MTETKKTEGMPRQGKRLLAAFFTMWIGFVVAWWFHQRPDPAPLYVVNGLPVAVDITVGERTLHLEPETHDVMVELPAGESELTVTGAGKTLATDTINLTRGRAMAIYNVLGAAFVYHRKYWYGFGFADEDADVKLYVDQAFHDPEFEKVQLIFEPPPERVSTELGSGDVYLRFVGVLDAGTGWRACVDELRRMGRDAEAEAVEARVREALPEQAG